MSRDKKIIGIDLSIIISEENIIKINSGKEVIGKEVLDDIINNISLLDKSINNIANDDLVYLFVPNFTNSQIINDSLNKLIKLLIKDRNLKYDKIVECRDDLVDASREYRVDVLVLPEYKNYKVVPNEATKAVANTETAYRRLNLRRKENKLNHILEYSSEQMMLIDVLPQYTNIIYLGENNSNFEDSDRVQFINEILSMKKAVNKAKNNIEKRQDNIIKAYNYRPKTGNVVLDEEWKKYWLASKFENDMIDSRAMNMSRFDFLRYHNRFNLDEEAIVYLPFNKKLTYRQLFQMVKDACKSFKVLGVNRGDVVTICLPNTIEDYVAVLALNHIGAIVNPIHPLSTTEKIERFVGATKPKFFICLDMPKSNENDESIDLETIMNKYNIEKTIVISLVESANKIVKAGYKVKQKMEGNNSRYNLPSKDKYINWDKFINIGKSYDKKIIAQHNPDDIAFYYSTGGTTSDKPKIVSLPYSMINLSYYNSYGINIEKGDTVFVNYPRYIAFSDENCTHLPASIGTRMVFTPYEYPEDLAKILEREKVTVMQMAPQFYQMMLDDEKKGNFDGVDLSAMKYIVAGGDKFDQVLKDKLVAFFARHNNTNVKFLVGYGCTEVAGSSIVQLFGTEKEAPENNVGIPLPVFKMKMVDEDGNETFDNKGRLLCGGNGVVMKGYLNDDEATKEVLIKDKNGDPYYDTADIVQFDQHGRCNFLTREKRFVMITREDCSGKAVPADIESIIMEKVDGVANCCVVGVEENNSMTLRAAVVLEDDKTPSDDLIAAIKAVAASKDIINSLSEVRFVNSLPLTDRGKIKYTAVEEMFKDSLKSRSLVKKKS